MTTIYKGNAQTAKTLGTNLTAVVTNVFTSGFNCSTVVEGKKIKTVYSRHHGNGGKKRYDKRDNGDGNRRRQTKVKGGGNSRRFLDDIDTYEEEDL